VKRVSVSGTYGREQWWETGEARSPSESFGAPVPVIKWGAGIMEATAMRYCARGNLYIPVVEALERKTVDKMKCAPRVFACLAVRVTGVARLLR